MATSATAGNPINKIERAHQMYREGKYEEALGFYTEALSLAKTKSQKIALHSNRAACFLKLHLFNKAADECTSVLELDHKHTGALMLRAQTLVTLKEYHSALFDVNRLIELNPSSEVYQNLHARLKTQLSLAPIPEAEVELEEDDEEDVAELEDDEEDIAELKDDDEEEHTNSSECNKDDEFQNEMHMVASEKKVESGKATPTTEVATQVQNLEKSLQQQSAGWQAIPQPKGHSSLDYSRWDSVEDESSEEEDDDEEDEPKPQYRFRVKTVGVRAVK
nr:sperm-associated antigen 1 [Ipomoea batatas]